MNRLSRRPWIGVAAAASFVLFAVLFAMVVLHVVARTPLALRGQVVIPDGQRPAPDFTLRDQNGRIVALRALHGRPVAITFLDSHCTQECPIEGRELALVQQGVDRTVPWTLLVVSIAPRTDTPASIRAFAREAGWRGDWRWLTGTQARLAAVWSAYGIYVKPTKGDTIHTAAVYLVGPSGSVRVADMVPFEPDQLAGSIRALGAGSSGGWPSWLPRL